MARILLTLVTLSGFAACSTLQPLPDAQPGTVRAAVQPGDKVEIERTDGTRQKLEVESVTETELVGTDGRRQHRVPLASIRTIATRTMTTQDKVWTGVAIAVVVGGIVAIASDGGGGGGGGSGGGGGY